MTRVQVIRSNSLEIEIWQIFDLYSHRPEEVVWLSNYYFFKEIRVAEFNGDVRILIGSSKIAVQIWLKILIAGIPLGELLNLEAGSLWDS